MIFHGSLDPKRHANNAHEQEAASQKCLQEIEIVELVAVLEDAPLDLGRVDPCDKVFEVSV